MNKKVRGKRTFTTVINSLFIFTSIKMLETSIKSLFFLNISLTDTHFVTCHNYTICIVK